MAYSKFHADWKDFPDTTTPITEAALEHIEQGIVDVEAAAAAALAAKRLDQLVAPTGDVSLNNQKIIGVGTPVSSTDAATKGYTDAVAQGLDPKASVRAATTANITLSGAQTIDGVAVVATNRVLVKNQTTGSENGIYVAAAGAWSRATDADVDAEVTAGMYTFIEEGTTLADKGWVLVTNNPITVGTTALSFTQFSGAGGVAASAVTVDSTTLVGTGTNAQAVFEELDDGIANHLADTSAAHAASAISFTPVGTVAATDVQAAIAEVASEGGGGGGSPDSDATVTFTDIVTNNASTSKHGFLAKLDNNRSHFMGGKGEWNRLRGTTEWFVDANAAAGGDGHSPAGAFTTFAAANAAASSRDIIYIMSDLTENCVVTVADIQIIGVGGKRVLYATASTAFNNYTMQIRNRNVHLRNLFFYGHATFKGIHLLFDLNAGESTAENIHVNGTGGAGFPNFYPTTPSAQPGIGGIGIAFHSCDILRLEDLQLEYCSIAIANGTWCTRLRIKTVTAAANAQLYVEGLNSGVHTSPAATGPWAYGHAGFGGENQTGGHHFSDWNGVSTAQGGFVTPTIDQIGDKTANCDWNQGSLWEKINMEEGGSGSFCRFGLAGNTFISCDIASPCQWYIDGQHSHLINTSNSNLLIVRSNFNSFDTMNQSTAFPNIILCSGSYNIFRNVDFMNASGVASSVTGGGNKFEKCRFRIFSGSTAPTRTSIGGPRATWTSEEGTYAITYATSMIPEVGTGLFQYIAVTNTTAFTIANPKDFSNVNSADNILCTNPMTIDIYNNSGGAMGTITWGSKYVLSTTITNPGNGKHLLITFIYNFTLDKWIETGRVLHT